MIARGREGERGGESEGGDTRKKGYPIHIHLESPKNKTTQKPHNNQTK